MKFFNSGPNTVCIAFFIISTFRFDVCASQVHRDLNLGFEHSIEHQSVVVPTDWQSTANKDDFIFVLDSNTHHSGKFAGLLINRDTSAKYKISSISNWAPLDVTAGDTIEFSGWIKADSITEIANLWLNIVNNGKILATSNFRNEPIRGSTQWKRILIKLKVPAGGTRIIFGCLLVGSGKFWMDDFKLVINGKDLVPVLSRNRERIEEAASFVNSGIKLDSLDEYQIKKLDILCHIWGFLKYYHPSVNSGTYDWDHELFKIISLELNVKSRDSFSHILKNWLFQYPIHDRPEKNPIIPDSLVCKNANLDWIDNSDWLDSTIQKYLWTLFRKGTSSVHFYVSLTKVGNPIVQNELSYPNINYQDDGIKLLTLFRYWNLINYFYPYKTLIGTNWDSNLDKFIPLFVKSKDSISYVLTTWKLVNSIHDNHANIWSNHTIENNVTGIYNAPFSVRFIGDTAVIANTLSNIPYIEKGDIITRINGISVSEIVKNFKPYSCASNKVTEYRNIGYLIEKSKKQSNTIEIFRERKKMQFSVTYSLKNSPITDPISNLIDSSYHLINSKIGYISLKTFTVEKVDSAFSLFKNTRGIIIDARAAPLDYTVLALSNNIFTKPQITVTMSFADLTQPGRFLYGPPIISGRNNSSSYRGKIAILVDEYTQSSSEYQAMILGQAPHSKIFGSQTAGADGNITVFTLPGNITTSFSGIGIYYGDHTQTQRIGLKPDITVYPTVDDIRRHNDVVLKKAQSWILMK